MSDPKPKQSLHKKTIMFLVFSGFLLLMVVPGFDHRWH
jgi:hypothetical protein